MNLAPTQQHTREAPFDLFGHVAVVTGGNGGIGLGIAQSLARAGAAVSIWGRDEGRNERARAQLREAGARALAVRCDVSVPADVDAAFATTIAELGKVDSCFANAGVAPSGAPFLEISYEEYRRVLATNLDGAFLTLQGAARHMVERGEGGSLVGIASLAALQGQPRGQHYGASKGGLVAMIRACAVELARHGVRANAIVPGWVQTPMMGSWVSNPRLAEKVLPHIPQRRWGTPADYGALAVYLAGPGSSYHTGDTIVVDGGYRVF